MTGEIAASIAVGSTLHLVNQSLKRRKIDEERLRLARGTHQLPHLVYGNAARQLGYAADISGPAPDGVLGPVNKAGQSRAAGANHTDDH